MRFVGEGTRRGGGGRTLRFKINWWMPCEVRYWYDKEDEGSGEISSFKNGSKGRKTRSLGRQSLVVILV